MEGIWREKVPNGKLLIVKLKYGTKIESCRIEGDFFSHPEDTIVKLERSIVGLTVPLDEAVTRNKLDAIISENRCELIGFSVEDLMRILKLMTEDNK